MHATDLSVTDWAAIAASTLFRGVSLDTVEGLLADCPVEEFGKETVMLATGEENTNVYLLLSGQANVHLGAGECVGELSLIDRRCVSAFVRVRLAVAAAPVMTDDSANLPAVTISLGLVEMRPDDTAEKLIAAADAAMYRAKQGGRNRVCD